MEYQKATKTDIARIAAMHIMPKLNINLGEIEKEKEFRFYLEKVNLFMEFEPGGVIVAKEADKIAGFIIVTKDIFYLMKNVFLRRYIFRRAMDFVRGRFGLSLVMKKKIIRFLVSLFFLPIFIIIHSKVARAKIVAIVVAEEKRNLGIGKSLIDKATQYLRENNIKSVSVTVQINNLLALKFYQNYDFFISGKCIESIGRSLILTKYLNN